VDASGPPWTVCPRLGLLRRWQSRSVLGFGTKRPEGSPSAARHGAIRACRAVVRMSVCPFVCQLHVRCAAESAVLDQGGACGAAGPASALGSALARPAQRTRAAAGQTAHTARRRCSAQPFSRHSLSSSRLPRLDRPAGVAARWLCQLDPAAARQGPGASDGDEAERETSKPLRPTAFWDAPWMLTRPFASRQRATRPPSTGPMRSSRIRFTTVGATGRARTCSRTRGPDGGHVGRRVGDPRSHGRVDNRGRPPGAPPFRLATAAAVTARAARLAQVGG
jgi:hypothetical protein